MAEEWTTVGKRERRPPKKFDDTFVVATKPKKPAPTALDAFIRDPKKKKPVYDMPSFVPMESSRTPVPANGSAGRQAKPNKKPKPQPELPAKRRFTGDKSFDPDVRQVKLDDLVRVFGESRIHFADTQSIWLKDMAAYLNHLLPYELSEPAFRKNNDPNYPSSLLKAEIRSFLREMLEDCANPTLQLFQSHCVETVIRNMGLQRPVAGYMVMLQVLGHEFPDVTVANMRTFVESVNVNRPRPAVAVPLCWLALQSMQSSPSHAAAMWTQLLSPLTGSSNAAHVRAYNDFAIHSLEVMLLKLSTDRDSRISPSSFTAIFDFLSHQKSSSNAGRAVPLFPMLVAASLRTDTEFSVLCEIFNHFLRRLSDASASKEEVRDVLLHCLLTGEEMFHHWVTVEHKFTNGSSLLLGHLSESGLLHKFPHRIVLETITQLKARAEANDNLISAQRSLQAIGVIQRKMSKSRIPVKSILVLVIALSVAAIAFDVHKHGSFKKSITGRNLHRYGIISAWNKSLAKATTYSVTATTWVSKNWPIFRAKVDPWISFAAVKVGIVYKYVCDLLAPAIEPVRVWAGKTIPPLVDRVKDKLLPLLVSFVKDFSNAVIAVTIELGKWVQENVLVGNFSLENLSRLAADSVTSIHSATGHAVSWFTGHVRALTN